MNQFTTTYKCSSILPWPPPSGCSRRQETILNRLRINHTLLTHRHLMIKEDPPTILPAVSNSPSSTSSQNADINKLTLRSEIKCVAYKSNNVPCLHKKLKIPIESHCDILTMCTDNFQISFTLKLEYHRLHLLAKNSSSLHFSRDKKNKHLLKSADLRGAKGL
ncbi:RNase H domain-containing protein [Aphis craccivora]|uniref:RNase H domain-containing protein n=1 Tax=Aphis craccivora TaxID=307492 RepID=A0A6G0ZPW3_APHCR|nr:RNase H domain-containing protein [Aphis craccivora]